MPESMSQEPNIYDPRSPDYAYASKSSSNKYRKQIDSEYDVPDEYIKERKGLEDKAFSMVGQIFNKYYKQIDDLAGDHQPRNVPQQVMAAPAQAGSPSAGYVQGKPPGWRGVRGILRWLWYGKHADNPDYAPYEVNPGEEQPVQREWASLNEYARFLERAEIAAEQITQELFGDILSEEKNEFQQKIANLLVQFKNELIRYVIRPLFHQFWRTGLHQGLNMQGGDQSGNAGDSKSDNTSTEPVSGGQPEGAAREKGTTPQSGVEPVSTSKPSSPTQRPKDGGGDDGGGKPGSGNDDSGPPTPSHFNGPDGSPGGSGPPEPGAKVKGAEKQATKEKQKKKRKFAYGDIVDMVEESGLAGSDIYTNPEIMAKVMSIGTYKKKENALRRIHNDFPLEWEDVKASLKAFVDSDLVNKPGGIVSAMEKVAKEAKNLPPEQVAQEMSDNPVMPHIWRIIGGIASRTVSLRTVKDEIIDLESQAIRNRRSGSSPDSTTQTTTPKSKEGEGGGVQKRMAKPRGKKNRQLGPVQSLEDVKKARQAAEEAEHEEANQKARERRAAKKDAAAKKAEKKVEKATSDEADNSDKSDTGTTTNVDDDNIVTMAPRSGSSKDEVSSYIKKAVEQSQTDAPDWVQTTKRDLFRLLDDWIGDDNKRTDWIDEEVDKAVADLLVGGSFDDDMQSDMESLGDRDIVDDRSNEAMVHMIGRKWLNSLTLEARKRYYKILMQEGRVGPYVRRSIVDQMPLQERNAYYRQLLKG